jgi:hypothetical protein
MSGPSHEAPPEPAEIGGVSEVKNTKQTFYTQNPAILVDDHASIEIVLGDVTKLPNPWTLPNYMLHRNGIFPWCICGEVDCPLAEVPPPLPVEPEPEPESEPKPEPEPEKPELSQSSLVPELSQTSDLEVRPACAAPGCLQRARGIAAEARDCSDTCRRTDLRAPVCRISGADVSWVDGEYALWKTRVVAPDKRHAGTTQRFIRVNTEPEGGLWYEVSDDELHVVMVAYTHGVPGETNEGWWEIGLVTEAQARLREEIPRPVYRSMGNPTVEVLELPAEGWQQLLHEGGGPGELRVKMLLGAERFSSRKSAVASRARSADQPYGPIEPGAMLR